MFYYLLTLAGLVYKQFNIHAILARYFTLFYGYLYSIKKYFVINSYVISVSFRITYVPVSAFSRIICVQLKIFYPNIKKSIWKNKRKNEFSKNSMRLIIINTIKITDFAENSTELD